MLLELANMARRFPTRLDAYRQRPDHVARRGRVLRRKVVAFSVHRALRKGIAAGHPFQLPFGELGRLQVPAQLCGARERERLRQNGTEMSAVV